MLTPADDAQTVDHGRVRVCSNETVGIDETVHVEDDATETFQVHLVDDAGTRRHDQDVLQCLRSPLKVEANDCKVQHVIFTYSSALLRVYSVAL